MFSASIFTAHIEPHKNPAGAQASDDAVKKMIRLGFSSYHNNVTAHL